MSRTTINPDKWIDKYSDYLFNFTLARVNDREVAKDLISETFLSALKAMKDFKGGATERTWLVSILKRKIIDYYRKVNSQKAKSEVKINYRDDDEGGKWLEEKVADSRDKNAEDKIENNELRLAIFECLDQLNERQAKIFKMKTIDGVDTETICNEFNITPSNLWVIIHRARALMAACLEKKWL
ncbi:MAG TPA: sigma-70 family RNA polymerase sigma factor [Flavobacteriaceae bacterium]|nr:sigma-70 family RNA polymerase sigma factor [Flavobacteriaceae bacterium]